MKIKTRLFIYNVLIVLISFCLIFLFVLYMSHNTSEVLYNVDSITVDENVNAVEEIMTNSFTVQSMVINLARYHYQLSIYEDGVLIYGEANSSLERLLEQYRLRKNSIRTLFVDNCTTVMLVEESRVYFAMYENQESKNVQRGKFSSVGVLLTRIISFILIILILILALAIFFSNRILKRVMKPVDLLKEGAERVQAGDYEKSLVYQNDDEFSSVIANFNEMQQTLKEKTERTKQYEQAKKEMINGISHDIRTPLTVVKGNIKGIQDGVASTKEKQNQYLSIAYHRVLDIENLLNQLFDTFNYETGEIRLHRERIDLSSYLKEVIYANENVVNQQVAVDMKLPAKEAWVFLDPVQLKRVFDNLINNAIRHNPQKKNLKITICLKKDNGYYHITFQDNGKGIKNENVDRIFEEFFKEDESRNQPKSGSGLGLFIVKQIIESHGGTIKARNHRGLLFEITLKGEE